MLLTELILSKRGPLAKVWLSAHHERKLSKQQALGVDVGESVGESAMDFQEGCCKSTFGTKHSPSLPLPRIPPAVLPLHSTPDDGLTCTRRDPDAR